MRNYLDLTDETRGQIMAELFLRRMESLSMHGKLASVDKARRGIMPDGGDLTWTTYYEWLQIPAVHEAEKRFWEEVNSRRTVRVRERADECIDALLDIASNQGGGHRDPYIINANVALSHMFPDIFTGGAGEGAGGIHVSGLLKQFIGVKVEVSQKPPVSPETTVIEGEARALPADTSP